MSECISLTDVKDAILLMVRKYPKQNRENYPVIQVLRRGNIPFVFLENNSSKLYSILTSPKRATGDCTGVSGEAEMAHFISIERA